MGNFESVLLSVCSAAIVSIAGIAGAFTFNYFLGGSLVVSLCIFMFVISFFLALSSVLNSRDSQKSFTRLRLEKNMSNLFWENSELQAKLDFLEKVGENAPESDLKKSYQANKRALDYLDK
ncbi:hypothetical protein ATHEMM101B_14855 [Atlantibacter hermannii]|uniref:hypothetical protein n=1 Tax=Atlantibacter hermannii TaxID=565 RepID=UPI003B2572B9